MIIQYEPLPPEDKKDISYPVLMYNNFTGSVVLFNTRTSGTLLREGKSIDLFGEFSRDWVEADNDFHWSVMKGTLTLSNE